MILYYDTTMTTLVHTDHTPNSRWVYETSPYKLLFLQIPIISILYAYFLFLVKGESESFGKVLDESETSMTRCSV
jgi:hypothetical protein